MKSGCSAYTTTWSFVNTANLLFSKTPKPFISSAVPIMLATSKSAALVSADAAGSSSYGKTLN